MREIRIGDRVFTPLFPDLLPPLTDEERAGLKAEIGFDGVMVAVMVDEHDGIIDGINRLEIAAELGLKSVPIDVVAGLSEAMKRHRALAANIHRRQMSQEKKREMIARELKADPARSNRVIAREVGVSHPTVATVREELEATGKIFQLPRTVGQDGKERPATKPAPQQAADPDDEEFSDEDAAAITEYVAMTETPAPPPAPRYPHSDRLSRWLSRVTFETLIIEVDLGGIAAMAAEPDKWDGAHTHTSILRQLREHLRTVQSFIREIEKANFNGGENGKAD